MLIGTITNTLLGISTLDTPIGWHLPVPNPCSKIDNNLVLTLTELFLDKGRVKVRSGVGEFFYG